MLICLGDCRNDGRHYEGLQPMSSSSQRGLQLIISLASWGSCSITVWFGLSSKGPVTKSCFDSLRLHRLQRKSHLKLQQEGTWESGFNAGDEMQCVQCVQNALCSPSDSAVSLQKSANISTASWQSTPEGKADALLILPDVGRLSIICVHRHNITLAQMKTWMFR